MKKVNPLRIALLLIGVLSVFTNFVLIVFMASGDPIAWYYYFTVIGVSLIGVAAAFLWGWFR